MSTTVAETPFPSAATMACPYGYYESLRAGGPVYRSPDRNEFFITRLEDILHVNRHPELFSSEHSTMEDGYMRTATLEERAARHAQGLGGIGSTGMVNSDPPIHTA